PAGPRDRRPSGQGPDQKRSWIRSYWSRPGAEAHRAAPSMAPMTTTTPAAPPSALDLPIPVRWTDLDAYGHVNNAAMVRLLEEARIAAFWQPPAEQLA